MVPTDTLGRLWTKTAGLFPVEFAMDVAEAHTDTLKVYGEWGEVMDVAHDVQSRLAIGLKLMAAHAADPKWDFKISESLFYLVRRWNYRYTNPRAEAFASLCEFREWLIVMQRHILQPIPVAALHLVRPLYQALEADERGHIGRFFGCDVCLSNQNAIAFPKSVSTFSSTQSDPEKLGLLTRHLKEMGGKNKRRLQNVESFATIKEATTFPVLLRRLRSGEAIPEVALSLGMSPERFSRYFSEYAGMEPWCFLKSEMGLEEFLTPLDPRHRQALHQAAIEGAEYIAGLEGKGAPLCGVDLGGGTLEVTEVFLRHLCKRINAPLRLTVVDPQLRSPSLSVLQRKQRLEEQTKVSIDLAPLRWQGFVKTIPSRMFDFVVSFQVLSLLSDEEIKKTFLTLGQHLNPRGRFFAAFEPYDKATLKQYRSLTFYPRPVDWYREIARETGFGPQPTTALKAHAEDPSFALVCFRFEKMS